MRKVHINTVVPGVKLAKTIFNAEGRVLLTSGMVLKENFIEKMKYNGIDEIFIHDELSNDIAIPGVVCDETRLEAKLFVKNIFENRILAESIHAGKLWQIISGIIDELFSNEDIIVNLSEIRSVDDYTFEHSVNVCILSLLIGISLGFDMIRLRDLGAGALLHDIGKMRVPQEILQKPSELTEEEFGEIKKHTLYGYEILKENKNINIVSAYIAFGHHERFDGSGYPLRLKSENIHQCARIVAVADVFDALSSDRVYRKKLSPHEVVEYISSSAVHQFDRQIVDSFMKYVAVYPMGSGVILNTDEKGMVVKLNKRMPTRPVVRVIFDRQERKVAEYYEVDLARQPHLFIKGNFDLESYII